MSGSKNALGTYKYIGIITDGSPIYSYEFNDEGSFRVTYIFREFRGNENKKIWTGRVNSFFPLLIFGSVYSFCCCTSKHNLYILDPLKIDIRL